MKPLLAAVFVVSCPSLSTSTEGDVWLWFFLCGESFLVCIRFIGVRSPDPFCSPVSEVASGVKFFCSIVRVFLKFFPKFVPSFVKVSDRVESVNRVLVGF